MRKILSVCSVAFLAAFLFYVDGSILVNSASEDSKTLLELNKAALADGTDTCYRQNFAVCYLDWDDQLVGDMHVNYRP